MPAVNTAVVRKGKRDARKHTSLAGRTISSSPRATASLNTSASISAPVKLEPTSATIPTSPTIRIPARAPSNTWRHRDELEFILATGEQWDDMSIVQFLRTNVLSVLPAPASTGERWIRVRCTDNSEVTLPRGYRIPLLWVLKFLWSSVAIVLHANEWNERKFDLLHVARLCATLVSGARAAAAIDNGKGGIDRSWRCAAFDRALRRYWNKWLVMRDDFVRDFWNEFGEEEFEEDVLRLGWGSWVLKGEKGFFLTKAEVANGITADEFMRGFVVDEEKKTFAWVEDSSNPSTTVEPAMSSPVEVPVLAVTSQIQTTTVSEQSKAPLSKSPPTPAAQLQPPPKTSLAAVQVGPPRKSPPVRVRSTKSGKQTGSVSLAELVSRIPLGGGRHRSHHQVETLAGRTRRMSEIANIENGEISPPGTQKIARKSSSAMSAPAEVVPTIAIPSLLQHIPAVAQSLGTPAAQEADKATDVEMRDASPALVQSASVDEANPSGNAMQAGEVANELGGMPLTVHPPPEKDGHEEEEERTTEVEKDELAHSARDSADQAHPEQETQIEPMHEDELDPDDELQLLYPQSPEKHRSPVHTAQLIRYGSPPPSHFHSHSRSPSVSSSSRSPSPVLVMSTARFPSETRSTPPPTSILFTPASTSTSPAHQAASTSQLMVAASTPTTYQLSPRRALAELAADPNLFARLTQSWGELRAEVGALRAELRAAPGLTAQLEERIRRLEQGSSTMAISSSSNPSPPPASNNATPHMHPLQHLIAGEEDTKMDVDTPAPQTMSAEGALTTRYAVLSGQKPLPPRSRKFSSTARLAAM